MHNAEVQKEWVRCEGHRFDLETAKRSAALKGDFAIKEEGWSLRYESSTIYSERWEW